MDVSGINKNFINNTIDNAKSSAETGGFEERLKAAMNNSDEKQLKKVCNEFESIMLNLLYKQMRATVPKSDFLGDSTGKDIFESMLDEQLMEKASERGSIGLGDMLFKQMKKSLNTEEETVTTDKTTKNEEIK